MSILRATWWHSALAGIGLNCDRDSGVWEVMPDLCHSPANAAKHRRMSQARCRNSDALELANGTTVLLKRRMP